MRLKENNLPISVELGSSQGLRIPRKFQCDNVNICEKLPAVDDKQFPLLYTAPGLERGETWLGKSLCGQNNEGRKTIQVRSMQDFPLESFCSVQSYTAWAGNGPSWQRMPRTLWEVRSPYRAADTKWNTTNTSRSLQLRLTGQRVITRTAHSEVISVK